MDSYRPDYGAPAGSQTMDTNSSMYRFRGNAQGHGDDKHRAPRDFTFRAPRHKIAERPLLTLRRHPSPDLVAPQGSGEANVKFRDVDQMTDSEAEDMEVSDEEEEEEGIGAKRLKLDVAAEEKNAPKWSNPDPYTALPPIEETTRKRTDVVKLIRKARVSAASEENADAAASNEDFISFDFGGMDADYPGMQAPNGAPKGPRSKDTSLGKRKRAADEDGRTGALKTLRGVSFHENAAILDEWKSTGVNATPWYKEASVHNSQPPLMRLHSEIIDFYDWVKPKDYEHAVRSELLTRLSTALRKIEPGCEVHAFGSYAAGLYLPTGDMDIVLFTADFVNSRRTGRPFFGARRAPRYYHKISTALERLKIPARPCFIIPRAKVPIIKFVDRISGIKVDLSFDNDTGVIANDTFQRWKLQYPAMPILVSVIKQFLMIRGLNDNAAGGLGGFSTICLVTSLVQMLPPSTGTPNLGRMLVEFFNLYGNLFNREELGIRMEPPGYFEKRSYKPFVFNPAKQERLSIIDPNKPENDISGGSHHIDIIFKAFAAAYGRLKERLDSITTHGSAEESLLEQIIGGNYQYYDNQRVHLQNVYNATHPHPVQLPPPPPSSLPPSEVRPPPPPASSAGRGHSEGTKKENGKKASKTRMKDPMHTIGESKIDSQRQADRTLGNVERRAVPVQAGENASSAIDVDNISTGYPDSIDQPPGHRYDAQSNKLVFQGSSAGERRADRVRLLRPDIQKIPATISLQNAADLGGYADTQALTEDLQRREGALLTIKQNAMVSANNFPELQHLKTIIQGLRQKAMSAGKVGKKSKPSKVEKRKKEKKPKKKNKKN